MCAALFGLIEVCSTIIFPAGIFPPPSSAFRSASPLVFYRVAPSACDICPCRGKWLQPLKRSSQNAPRSKYAFKYPPPATSTRAIPSTFPNAFAISCAIARGAFFNRFANSKHTGEAASPISIFGGRSNTTASSTPYFSRMCEASAALNLSTNVKYTRPHPRPQSHSSNHITHKSPQYKSRIRHPFAYPHAVVILDRGISDDNLANIVSPHTPVRTVRSSTY